MKFTAGVGKRYGRRHTPCEMNRTETRYAGLLQGRLLCGEISAWHFEAMTFKLAANLRYTPDFNVFHHDGSFELIDVKGTGPIDDKSVVKTALILGKHVHVGRVNTIKRFRWFHDLGAHTCDGSGVAMYDHMLEKITLEMNRPEDPGLFGVDTAKYG